MDHSTKKLYMRANFSVQVIPSSLHKDVNGRWRCKVKIDGNATADQRHDMAGDSADLSQYKEEELISLVREGVIPVDIVVGCDEYAIELDFEKIPGVTREHLEGRAL